MKIIDKEVYHIIVFYIQDEDGTTYIVNYKEISYMPFGPEWEVMDGEYGEEVYDEKLKQKLIELAKEEL